MKDKKDYNDYEMPSLSFGGTSDNPQPKKNEEIKSSENESEISVEETAEAIDTETTAEASKNRVDDIVSSITSAPMPDMDFSDYMNKVDLSNVALHRRPMPKLKPRKSYKALITVAAVFAVLVGGLVAAYSFVPQVKNFVNARIMSATAYNKFVEKTTAEFINEQYDKENELAKMDFGADVSLNASGAEVNATINKKDGKFLLNGKSAGQDVLFYGDDTAKEYYLQTPQSSDSTVQIASKLISELKGKTAVNEYISDERAKELVLKYSDILCKNVSNAKKDLNGKAYINGRTYKQTKITYNLSSYDMTDTLASLLDCVRNDSEVMKYFSSQGVTKAQVDQIYNTLSMMGQGIYGEFPYTCDVEKYINKSGIVTGMKFAVYNKAEVKFDFGFNVGVIENKSADIFVWVNQGAEALFCANLSCTADGGKYSGAGLCELKGETLFSVKCSGLEIVKSKELSFVNGTVDVLASGTDYVFVLSNNDDKQLAEFSVKESDSELYKGKVELDFVAEDIVKPEVNREKLSVVTDKEELTEIVFSLLGIAV